jgi:hypothetical protein
MANFQKTEQHQQRLKVIKVNKSDQKGRLHANPEQIQVAPETLQPEDVLAAQQQYGNQMVQRLLDEKTHKGLVDTDGNMRDELSDSIQQARHGGSPLDKDLRIQAKQILGKEFDGVRIHTDEKANQLSHAINARAFTIGNDIFFKSGAFSPETSKGRETLIHELTHVVQQGGDKSARGRLKLGGRSTVQEQEADRLGKKNAQGSMQKTAMSISYSLVQKSEEDEVIQGQLEEEVVQGQAEEEEIQKQPADEEEIQKQAESAGVVQREGPDEDDWDTSAEPEKQPKHVSVSQEDRDNIQKRLGSMVSGQTGKSPKPSITHTAKKWTKPTGPANPGALLDQIKSRGKKDGDSPTPKAESTFKPGEKPSTPQDKTLGSRKPPLPFRPASKPRSPQKEMIGTRKPPVPARPVDPGFVPGVKPSKTPSTDISIGSRKAPDIGEVPSPKNGTGEKGNDAKAKEKSASDEHRESLISKIKDPKTSTEDSKAAEKQLRALYKRTGRFNYAGDALKQRRNSLRSLAQSGDKDAWEKFQKPEEKPETKKQKIGKFLSWAKEKASPLIEKIGGMAGGKIKEAKEHFGGKSEEKDEKETTKGGGGSGSGGVTAMISELYQENKQLKEKIKELEKAKSGT